MGTEKFSKHKDLLYIRYKLHGKLLADPFWNSVERDIFFSPLIFEFVIAYACQHLSFMNTLIEKLSRLVKVELSDTQDQFTR